MAATTKNMTFDVNLLPATTGDHNLGSSELKWGNLYSTTAQFSILRAPTSSGGTSFGPGSANNLLKSNGTSVYWTTLAASDIPTISITDKTSGTLPPERGGTGQTSIANIQAGKDGDGNVISSTYLKLNRTRLYTGPTEVVSTNTLSDDLQNYKLLKITFITNQEYKNVWLDTAEDFRFNKYYVETVCGGSNFGSLSSFYISQCDIMFTNGTTFTTNSNYNNANYVLRVHSIDGYK